MKTLRFHKTENIAYPMIYDANTDEEYPRMYDLLPLLNELNWENERLQAENDELKTLIRKTTKDANDFTNLKIQI